MKPEMPHPPRIPALRALWKEAFGDDDAFLDDFFRTAFSAGRCRCITDGASVQAALYWLDCLCVERKFAYLYAVATAENARGRGLCRELMEDTHRHLRENGYAGAILVPGSEALSAMYSRMGYAFCTRIAEFDAAAAGEAAEIHPIAVGEYAALRRNLLPRDAVIQEGENLAFLASQAELYAGDGFVFAVQREEDFLRFPEYLGDRRRAAGIVRALGGRIGRFRTVGEGREFAMLHPLTADAPIPAYFGFAFD